MLPLVWRPAAWPDAADLSAHYGRQGGAMRTPGFPGELEATFDLVASYPESGATRDADLFPELPVPLRFHPLRRFKRMLVYYLALPDRVEVIRIWNAARGLEALVDDSWID